MEFMLSNQARTTDTSETIWYTLNTWTKPVNKQQMALNTKQIRSTNTYLPLHHVHLNQIRRVYTQFHF